MDLISRQAAIDVLSQYPFEKVVNCISILEELPSAQPEQRWTPVSEGLPKENKTVIASTLYGVFPEAKYTKEYGWEWAYEAGADYWEEIEGVIAWMPLPEPYKGEKE